MENYAQLPDGRLLIADGVNPMKVWDGLAPAPVDAGLAAPATAPTITGSVEPGPLLGAYRAFVRYVDALGQVSDPSPVSEEIEAVSGFAIGVPNASQTKPIAILFDDETPLATGNVVVITGAAGMVELNATWRITKTSPNRITLDNSDGRDLDAYTAASATLAAGADSIHYSDLPVPASARIVAKQLLRNTAGQASVYYVDATLAPDVLVYDSTLSDDDLSTHEAVAVFNPDGTLNAYSHGVPPAHKSVIAHHLGRGFAAVDGVVSRGAVVVTSALALVEGIGTNWKATLAGRVLYVNGAPRAYEIASVDEAEQTLLLTAVYGGASDPYAEYSIRPQPAERRLVYYSQPGEPESWPATNALELQEDGDEITALMVKSSFIYILCRRHLYRFTFQTSPQKDGQVFLGAERGCLNQRCWVQAEDTAYMLDHGGVHAFSGADDTPISTQIQTVFEPGGGDLGINWRAAESFHAVLDRRSEIIRWFVALGGDELPRHALAYHYRLKRWWVEEYPFRLGASADGDLSGYRRAFAAGEAGRVFLLDEGPLDGVAPGACTLRGGLTSHGFMTLTDAEALFTAPVLGLAVTITEGKGAGQSRKIVLVAQTVVTLDRPWLDKPDETSRYQIGGVPWQWKSGSYVLAPAPNESNRRFGLYFTPNRHPAVLRARLWFDEDLAAARMDHDHRALDLEGFTTEKGSPDMVLDLTRPDGFAQQRLDGHREENFPGPRQVVIELLGVANEDGLTVSAIELDGVRPKPGG